MLIRNPEHGGSHQHQNGTESGTKVVYGRIHQHLRALFYRRRNRQKQNLHRRFVDRVPKTAVSQLHQHAGQQARHCQQGNRSYRKTGRQKQKRGHHTELSQETGCHEHLEEERESTQIGEKLTEESGLGIL